MEKYNRDLLVLFREESNPQILDREVELLNELLAKVEAPKQVALAHEVIDLNKRKVVKVITNVQKLIAGNDHKPFVFINNLN